MEKQIITVLLNDRPYHLTLEVEQTEKERIYRVSNEQGQEDLSDFIPDPLEFGVNGTVRLRDRIRTVEGQEIARLIWNAIRERFGEPGGNEPEDSETDI
jgi:hypothetical protein